MRDWAAEHAPGVDVALVTAEFIDYWIAVPGTRGTKLDWEATWRNRLRETAQRRTTASSRSAGPGPGRSTTDDRVAAAQALKGQLQPTRDTDQLALGGTP